MNPGSKNLIFITYFRNKDKVRKIFIICFLSSAFITALIHGCSNLVIEMGEGQKLYRAKCSSCHNLIEPDSHDIQTWRLYVDKYGKKMTEQEKRSVLDYLSGPTNVN